LHFVINCRLRAESKDLETVRLRTDATLYTQTRIIPNIHCWVTKCKKCGATYKPHPVDLGKRNVSLAFLTSLLLLGAGIFCYSTKRFYTLPLLWYWRQELLHGLAPEGSIRTWASSPLFQLTRSAQHDRYHFHAFICHLVQVLDACFYVC
jgi:hypothetical protein